MAFEIHLISRPENHPQGAGLTIFTTNPAIPYAHEKTVFEKSRYVIPNPSITNPEELHKWQTSLRFDTYTGPGLLPCRTCSSDDLPDEFWERDTEPITFRDAFEDTGTAIQVNMPKARGIYMDRIRVVRNAELVKADLVSLRAIEAGDMDAQSTIATEKQILRDIPQTFDLTTDNDTPVELLAKWPEGLSKE